MARENTPSRRNVLKSLGAAGTGIAGTGLIAGRVRGYTAGSVTIWIYHDDRHSGGANMAEDAVDQLETTFDDDTYIDHDINVSGVYEQSYVYNYSPGSEENQALRSWRDVIKSSGYEEKVLHLWMFDLDHWQDEHNPHEADYLGRARRGGGVDHESFSPVGVISHTMDGEESQSTINRRVVNVTGMLFMHPDLEHKNIYNWYDPWWRNTTRTAMGGEGSGCDVSQTEADGYRSSQYFGEFCGRQMEHYISNQTYIYYEDCHLR